MTDSPSQTPGDPERQIEAVAEEYLAELQAGRNPDMPTILAAHPDLAERLKARLALVERLFRAGQRAAAATPASDGNLPAGRAHRLKCPHCGNGIQIVEPRPREVTCLNCGSSFAVDPEATATYRGVGPGSTIGRFQVLELLGRGAFGEVYKARDPQLDRTVAVKIPRAEYFSTAEEEQRFLREARSAAGLRHPGIVQVHEIAHEGSLPYIVSDYIEGLTLADLISGGRPGFRQSAELVALLADALDFAPRRKVIHRDIKPSNILLASSCGAGVSPAVSAGLPPDSPFVPYLTDFGLARRDEGEITVTIDGQVLGTPAYMSPEQAAGDHAKVDGRSDVYSLGVVLYELISGELPFRGSRRMLLHQVLNDEPRAPRTLNDQIPRDLETICLMATGKEPLRRYATAADFADDLRRFLRGDAIRARPVGRLEKAWRWARRNPVTAALAATAVLALATTTAVATSFAVYQTHTSLVLASKSDDLKDALATSEAHRIQAEERTSRILIESVMRNNADAHDVSDLLLQLADALMQLPEQSKGLERMLRKALAVVGEQVVPRVDFPSSGYANLSCSLDGSLCATFSEPENEWSIWDIRSGTKIRSIPSTGASARSAAEFTADNDEILLSDGSAGLALWSVSGGAKPIRQFASTIQCDSVRFAPDQRRFVVAADEGLRTRFEVWDVDGPGDRPIATFQNQMPCRVLFVCADGETVVCRAGRFRNGPIQLLDLMTGIRKNQELGGTGEINAFAAAGRGELMISGGEDHAIRFWTAQWTPARPAIDVAEAVLGLALSNDGGSLIYVTETSIGTVRGSEPRPEVLYRINGDDVRYPVAIDEDAWFGGSNFAIAGVSKVVSSPPVFNFGNSFGRHADATNWINRVHPMAAPRLFRKQSTTPQSSFFYFSQPVRQLVIEPSSIGGSPEDVRLWASVATCRSAGRDGYIHELSEDEWEPLWLGLQRVSHGDDSGLFRAAARDPLYWCRHNLRRWGVGARFRLPLIDRLIAAEPRNAWNFAIRGENYTELGDYNRAARDLLEFRALGGRPTPRAAGNFALVSWPRVSTLTASENAKPCARLSGRSPKNRTS